MADTPLSRRDLLKLAGVAGAAAAAPGTATSAEAQRRRVAPAREPLRAFFARQGNRSENARPLAV